MPKLTFGGFEQKVAYVPLDNSNEDFDKNDGSHRNITRRRTLRRYLLQVIVVICAAIALIEGIAIIELRKQNFRFSQAPSFSTGYSTDFVSAREHIEVSETAFTGGLVVDDQGNLYAPNPPPLMYVGSPYDHPEIDDNWEKATWGRYVLITENEARITWGDEMHQYWDDQRGGYVAGFDMFHTLHCLNNIRKTFWSDYYPPTHNSTNKENGSHHMDHCIDQIRQYIMCSGDMTTIGTRFYPGLGRNYVHSDVLHTCRNFEKLRDWMVDRYDGPGGVAPKSRTSSH